MAIQLRQLCLVASELEPVVTALEQVFGLARCYVDDGVAQFGLQNTLLPVGVNFLEVVAPVQANTAAGRYLERRQGDGGYMVITQADSPATHDAFRARARDLGIRVAFEVDRAPWRLTQLHPGDMQAAFLEIESDDRCDFQGQWHPAGGLGWAHCVRQERVIDVLAVELQCQDPEALAARWAAVLDVPPAFDGSRWTVLLNNAALYFVPLMDDRGPGLRGVHLAVRDGAAIEQAARALGLVQRPGEVELGGVCWRLIEAQESATA